MTCFPCIKCYKCQKDFAGVVMVCASCGASMPPGVSSCESCGGTKRKLVRPLANEVGGAFRESSRLARRELS